MTPEKVIAPHLIDTNLRKYMFNEKSKGCKVKMEQTKQFRCRYCLVTDSVWPH